MADVCAFGIQDVLYVPDAVPHLLVGEAEPVREDSRLEEENHRQNELREKHERDERDVDSQQHLAIVPGAKIA